jgi:bifunctional DNA-binding transcriptional regulator/antitoxin component of YhaV-PrlF toxin-antitoxin module
MAFSTMAKIGKDNKITVPKPIRTALKVGYNDIISITIETTGMHAEEEPRKYKAKKPDRKTAITPLKADEFVISRGLQ